MRSQRDLFESPSLVSKDPDGFNPSFDQHVGMDPSGFHPSHPLSPNHLDFTGNAINSNGNSNSNAGTPQGWTENPSFPATSPRVDVAKIVGVPPPPPSMPPPDKKSKSRNRSRPVGDDLHLEQQPPKDSFDELMNTVDPAMITASSTISSMSTPFSEQDPHNSNFVPRLNTVSSPAGTDPAIQLAVMTSPTNTKLESPSPSSLSSTPKLSVAEKRRRAALAMYESTELILDQTKTNQQTKNKFGADENVTPSDTAAINTTHTASTPTANTTTQRRRAAASPGSAATEPHSNKTYKSKPNQATNRQFVKQTKPVVAPPPPPAVVSNSSKKTKGKRGFLKKIFGAKKPKDETPTPRVIPAPTVTKPLKPLLKKPEERVYKVDLNTVAMMGGNRPVANVPPPPPPPVMTEPSPKAESTTFMSPTSEEQPFELQASWTMDPPNEEDFNNHSDPPILSMANNDPPLQLTFSHSDGEDEDDEDEMRRIESVRSRISGIYQPEPAPADEDDNNAEVFFRGDEPRIVTPDYPEPVGEYRHPQSTRGDKSTAATAQPTPVNSVFNLNLKTKEMQSMDPVGESPIHNVAGTPGVQRQYLSPFNSADPLGDSPFKAEQQQQTNLKEAPQQAQLEPTEMTRNTADAEADALSINDIIDGQLSDVSDPPLTMMDGYVSEESSIAGGEEKKEEDKAFVATRNTLRALRTPKPIPEEAEAKAEQETENSGTLLSRATKAALKLTQPTAIDSLKDQLDKVPTPTHQDDSRVGSAPVMGSGKPEATFRNPRVSYSAKISRDDKAAPSSKLSVDTSTASGTAATTTAAKKPLSVTAAAYTNAKAVAYLHKLQGSPSPRHSWHRTKQSSDSTALELRKMKSPLRKLSKKSAPSEPVQPPSPYGWNDKYSGTEITDASREFPPRKEDLVVFREDQGTITPPKTEAEEEKIVGTKLSGYRSNFKGRKPGKKKAKMEMPPSSPRRQKYENRSGGGKDKSSLSDQGITLSKELFDALYAANNKPSNFKGSITSLAVSRGIKLRRKKRVDDIESGRSTPVILTPRQKPTGGNRFNFVPANEAEIKDPIQRAGRRLLSKAAIPIQCAGRRFIAKREAIDRMWALIELQSYFRRWRAETNLQAHVDSATMIQKVIRAYLAKQRIEEMHASATQLQKIVRGYLASAHVYDQMYFVVQIQAVVRMFLGKVAFRAHRREVDEAVPVIQAQWRGHQARQAYQNNLLVSTQAVTKIQTLWRMYDSRNAFQFCVVDVIIAQSVFRRWIACQHADALRYEKDYNASSKIQATWRGHHAVTQYRHMTAAMKIQALWRGHQAHTSYKLVMAVIKIQTTWRGYEASSGFKQFMAARKIQTIWRGYQTHTSYKEVVAATKIQALWRGYKACTYYRLVVAAIKIQTVWRRHEAYSPYKDFISARKIQTMWRAKKDAKFFRQTIAARKIQSAWRGFQSYTDYIFSLVDILVVQRTVRQWLACKKAAAIRQEKAAVRIQKEFRRYSAQGELLHDMVRIIVVQSVVRKHNAHYRVQERLVELEAERQLALRHNRAATQIQKAWRGFWGFSHYIIMQYEITRIQSVMRGKLARQAFSLKLGCAIIMQATARQFLAKQRVKTKVVDDAAFAGRVLQLREASGAKKIQFWWRIVLDWTREKKAALVIERFFIHVRAEVDREILRREIKRQTKKDKKRKKKKDTDDQLLERVWLKTVDEDGVDQNATPRAASTPRSRSSTPRSASSPKVRSRPPPIAVHQKPASPEPGPPPKSKSGTPRSVSTPKNRSDVTPRSVSTPKNRSDPMALATAYGNGYNKSSPKATASPDSKMVETGQRTPKYRASSPKTLKIDSRQEMPTDMVHMAPSEDVSEISNITGATGLFRSMPSPSSHVNTPRSTRVRDPKASPRNDETTFGTDTRSYLDTKQKRSSGKMTTEDYIKKYAMKGASGDESKAHKTSSTRKSTGGIVSGIVASTDKSSSHFFNDNMPSRTRAVGDDNVGHSVGGRPSSTHNTPRSATSTPRGSSSPRNAASQQSPSSTRSSSRQQGQQRTFVPPSPTARSVRGKEKTGFFSSHTQQPTPPRHEKYLGPSRSHAETVDTALTQSSTMTPTSKSQTRTRSPVRVLTSFNEALLGDEYGEV